MNKKIKAQQRLSQVASANNKNGELFNESHFFLHLDIKQKEKKKEKKMNILGADAITLHKFLDPTVT